MLIRMSAIGSGREERAHGERRARARAATSASHIFGESKASRIIGTGGIVKQSQ